MRQRIWGHVKVNNNDDDEDDDGDMRASERPKKKTLLGPLGAVLFSGFPAGMLINRYFGSIFALLDGFFWVFVLFWKGSHGGNKEDYLSFQVISSGLIFWLREFVFDQVNS